ncbi:MAG: hypothetical protein ABI175_04725, partial [Polyangiales bacterium]
KLAIRTGLGIKKARLIRQGAQQFLETEQKVINEARKVAGDEREATAKRVAAEEAAKPKAEG